MALGREFQPDRLRQSTPDDGLLSVHLRRSRGDAGRGAAREPGWHMRREAVLEAARWEGLPFQRPHRVANRRETDRAASRYAQFGGPGGQSTGRQRSASRPAAQRARHRAAGEERRVRMLGERLQCTASQEQYEGLRGQERLRSEAEAGDRRIRRCGTPAASAAGSAHRRPTTPTTSAARSAHNPSSPTCAAQPRHRPHRASNTTGGTAKEQCACRERLSPGLRMAEAMGRDPCTT